MKEPWPFVISLLGLAVSAAALILLLPSLFDSGDKPDAWLYVVLAAIAAACGAAAQHWRPVPPRSGER